MFGPHDLRSASRSGPSDRSAADLFIRRLDLPLRAPDAINIAIAQRVGATLATFDDKMAECARTLGTNVAVA
jgi:predicted nucleic acid-binding protein